MGVKVLMRFCQTTYYEGTVELTDSEYLQLKEDMKSSFDEIEDTFCPESYDILEKYTSELYEEEECIYKGVQIIKLEE